MKRKNLLVFIFFLLLSTILKLTKPQNQLESIIKSYNIKDYKHEETNLHAVISFNIFNVEWYGRSFIIVCLVINRKLFPPKFSSIKLNLIWNMFFHVLSEPYYLKLLAILFILHVILVNWETYISLNRKSSLEEDIKIEFLQFRHLVGYQISSYAW